MDPIDKAIVKELIKNNRRTYAYLGKVANVTSKTARMRVERLVDDGTVEEFMVLKSLKMSGYDLAFIVLKPDKSVDPEELVEQVLANPMVYVSAPLTTGAFILHAEYQGSEGLSELTTFLRSLHGVEDADIHPTVRDRGGVIELKPAQKKILSYLMVNARLPISELAKRTRFGARRVRRLLDEMVESRGIQFAIKYNPNKEDEMDFIVKIGYDTKVMTGTDLGSLIEKHFPREYFRSHFSAIEPTLFSVFTIEHLIDVEKVITKLRKIKGILDTEVLLYYNSIILDPPRRTELREELEREGYFPPT